MLLRVLYSTVLLVCLNAAPLPTPEQFAGFRMGTDKKLVRWERIVEYMRLAEAARTVSRSRSSARALTAIRFLTS